MIINGEEFNTVQIHATCPKCGPVTFPPTQWDEDKEGRFGPTGGICPKCKAFLQWEIKDSYLSKFEPADYKLSEQCPEVKIEITPMEP